MLQLAFVALLTGSLIGGGTPDKGGGTPGGKDGVPATTTAEDAIINDTYSFGSPAETRFKFWVSYALGEIDEVYNASGNKQPFEAKGTIPGTITSQRLFFGGQFDVVSTEQISFGIGAQLQMAQNKFEVGGTFPGLIPTPGGNVPVTLAAQFDERDSGFGLQNIKFYGELRGKVLGIHGGYVLDMAEEPTYELVNFTVVNPPTGIPSAVPNVVQVDFPRSDEQDAYFIGASFDYPSTWLRIFGGLDYYLLQEGDTRVASTTSADFSTPAKTASGNDVIFFNLGAGVKISFIELGVAAILRAQLEETNVSRYPLTDTGGALRSGGHQGSLVPYLVLSPANIPVSLSIRGAVTDEYGDYGLSLGGGNEFVTQRGFTAALTVGF